MQLVWIGSGGEGMQVFHVAVQLMQKALGECRKPCSKAFVDDGRGS